MIMKPDKEKSREELLNELLALRSTISDLSHNKSLATRDQELLNKINQEATSLSLEDIEKLILDHQIYSNELEQQNEELREAQQNLEISRRKYSDLFNLAPFGYLILDKRGVILETNLMITHMLQREQTLLHNKPFVAHIVGDDQAEFFIFLKRIVSNDTIDTIDLRIITATKKFIDSRISGIRILSEDEKVVTGCLLAVIDVTKTKETQRLLQESESKYKMLIENIKDGIFIIQNGCFEFINPAFHSMFGYQQEEVLGKHFSDFIAPEDRELVLSRYQKRLRGEDVPTNYEFRIIHKSDRNYVFVSMHVSLISYNGAVATLGVIKDVSNNKKTEYELKRTQNLYHSTLNLLPDFIFVVDESLNVILTNTALLDFQAKHGLATDVANKPYYEAFPFFKDEDTSEYKRVFETGREAFKEIKTDHGEQTLYLEIIKTPVFQNDIVIRVITTIRNITQKKEDELNIKKYADELKELNKTKDQFISILAHDLKNPFTSLLSVSDYLARQVDKLSKEKIAKLTQNINTSSGHVYKLLENLLQWAHIQAGKFEFYPKYFRIADVVEEVFMLYNASANEKHIILKNEIDGNTEVFADYNMVETILRNLLSNAIKFTKDHGLIKIFALKQEEYIEICVEDNGVGISKDNIEKIFGIDSNVSTLGTNDEKGTGFGLVLCKEFVKLHKGEIKVESEPGKGSKFYFTLPSNLEQENRLTLHKNT